MNVKSIPLFLFISIGIQSSFSHSKVSSLSDTIAQTMFSPQNWKTYKTILAKDITKLPNDVRTKLFNNRTYKNISFVGFPIQGIHFENCTFINVDFRGMDFSLTTFSQCKFQNVKIEGITLNKIHIEQLIQKILDCDLKGDHITIKNLTNKLELKEEWKRRSKVALLHLIKSRRKRGSNAKALIDQLQIKREWTFNSHESHLNLIKKYAEFVNEEDFYTTQFFNEFIFKNIEIELKNCDLSNYNLKGIQLKNAFLENVILRQVREAQFKSCTLNRVDFQNADLTTTTFDGNECNDLKIDKAILHKNIRWNNERNDLEGIRNYSHLMNKSQENPDNQELLDSIQVLNKSFSIARLDFNGYWEADLPNLNLQGINFYYANLTFSNLSNTNLTGADLTGANLSSTNLQGVKLSDTLVLEYNEPEDLFLKWIDAEEKDKILLQKLINTDFINFERIPVEFIAFLKSRDKTQPLDLRYTNFCEAHLEGADFEGADLSHACFQNTDLTNAKFKGATLTNTSFYYATLTGADFRGTDITQAFYATHDPEDGRIKTAYLSSTWTIDLNDPTHLFRIWTGPDGKDKDIVQWLIKQGYPVLNKVPNEELKNFFNNHPERHLLDLRRAYLKGAQLQGVNLSDINLLEAKLRKANLSETLFINSNLTKVKIKMCQLNKTDFRGANLHHAYIDYHNFKDAEVNLEGANLQEFAYLCYDTEFIILPNYDHLSELFDQLVETKAKSKEDNLTEKKLKELEEQYMDGKGWKAEYQTEVTKRLLQKFVNSGVTMFAGVPYQKLRNYFNNRDKIQILNLYNSNFERVNLQGIDFSNADLRKANFKDANLKDVNLIGARISNTYMVMVGYLEDYSDKALYEEALNNWHSFDSETKQAFQAILKAKGFNLENQEPLLKRIKLINCNPIF